MKKKLADLVIQENTIHEEVIAEALDPYICFTEDGEIIFKERFDSLKAKEKVLCIFLGLKALNYLDKRDTPAAGPTEASNMSGVPVGTVKVYALELRDDRLLTSKGGKYEVLIHSINRIAGLLKVEE